MSIAHPCTDTPFRRWQKDDAGNKQWLCIDRYYERGAFTYAWKGWRYDFRTSAYHATLEDWFAWIAETLDEGGPLAIGAVWMQLIEKVPNPVVEKEAHAYVTNLFVLESERGRGAGSMLLDAAVSECRAWDVDTIILWPTPRSR